MDKTGFQEWDETYRVVCCLKENAEKKTYLLEERDGLVRKVCKIASCGQSVFLKQEYEILARFSDIWRFTTLEFREREESCALLRDYVEGTTLEETVERDGVLEAEDAARLGIRLCRVLRVLHSAEPPVIHRDLKPENILVMGSGKIRLIDFETARFYKPGQDADTVRLGTRGYAAPEQFGHGQTDARTDIYAVGKLLLYMTEGDCGANASGAFGRIIKRCCDYNPDRRYADVGRLENALQGFLERGANRRGLWKTGMAAVLLLFFLLGRFSAYLPGQRAAGREQLSVSDASAWNPEVYRENVDEIVRCLQEEGQRGLADACETLVRELGGREALRAVEPVAYWNLDEEGLAEYQTSRLGYEFIADRLACGDGLLVKRLGTYGECVSQIARGLRARIDYTWKNDDGTPASGPLRQYVVFSDDRNLDGCMIEILEVLLNALQQK